jgi:hypothetical protein
MLAGLIKSLILSSLFMVSSARASWLWPFSKPSAPKVAWMENRPMCDRALGKESPELLAFIEEINADRNRLGIGLDTHYKHARNFADYNDRALKLMTEVLDRPLYMETSPRVRAQMVSYLLVDWLRAVGSSTNWEWFDRENKSANGVQAELIASWIMAELDKVPGYSAEDLERIRVSFHRALEYRLHRNMDPPSTLQQRALEEKFLALTAKGSGLQELVRRWENLGELLLPSKALRTQGSLKRLAEESMKVLVAQPAQRREARRLLVLWIKSLGQINPINWREMVEVLRIFRSAALEIEFSEAERLPLIKAVRELSVRWTSNEDAVLGIGALLENFFEQRALPQ